MKRYSVNDGFFSELTPCSSYWAGFIAGDGCVSSTVSSVTIYIHARDTTHLMRFKEDINFEGPIRRDNGKGGYAGSRNAAVIRISSKTLVKDLSFLYNIEPRKTHTLREPNIQDKELIKAYITGLIDSDGTILRRLGGVQKGELRIVLYGTLPLLSWVQEQVDLFSPPLRTRRSTPRKMSLDSLVYGYEIGSRRAEILKDKLIQVDIPRLSRKWDCL
jgi:hypothetical protein